MRTFSYSSLFLRCTLTLAAGLTVCAWSRPARAATPGRDVIAAAAQAMGASVSGMVTEDSGAALVGAWLTLADVATGVQRTATSDARGAYVFAGLPAGRYTLSAGREGFSPMQVADIVIAENEQRTIPVQLKIGPLSESISVEGVMAPRVTLGKDERPLRDIPQSVSIVTRERLDEQNLTSLAEAMKTVTGVSVQRVDGAGNFNDFTARGYSGDTLQIDGVTLQSNSNAGYADLALYERIEVLRGAAGLFRGAGEPGLAINLLRKRAPRRFQLKGTLAAGSWDAYRADVDLGGALIPSGRLRARLVAVTDDRQSYLNGVHGDTKVAYATMEYDLTARTTLAAGGTYQDVDSVMYHGLPAYADGRLIDVPRSTAIVADWGRQDLGTHEGFVELEHRPARGGQLRGAVRHYVRPMFTRFLSTPTAFTDDGNRTASGFINDRHNVDTSADVYYTTPLRAWGLTHNLLIGADYRRAKARAAVRTAGVLGVTNLFTHDPSFFPEPTQFTETQHRATETESYGGYTQLRVKPTAAITLIGGGRVSWWGSNTFDRLTNRPVSSYDEHGAFTPYAAVVADLSAPLSAYVSYAEIFQPQNALTASGEQLEPRVGRQYEGGVKGVFAGGRLNTHAAVFRIEDENRAIADPLNPTFSLAIGKARSQGIETEVTGQIARGLHLTSGYTFTTTEYVVAPETQVGTPFSSFTPRHMVTVWANYTRLDGRLAGLQLGGGVRAVSEFSNNFFGVPVRAPGYAVASLRAAYRVTRQLTGTINVENLFDRTYYEKVAVPTGQNYYGAPRSVTVALRVGF